MRDPANPRGEQESENGRSASRSDELTREIPHDFAQRHPHSRAPDNFS
jgi:hypothetical protein